MNLTSEQVAKLRRLAEAANVLPNCAALFNASERVLQIGYECATRPEVILALLAERETMKKELEEANHRADWQNWPNRNPADRGGYEFYVNEEWTGLASAAIDTDPGFRASLTKRRYDPDDERVRVRRVNDDDALLSDLKTTLARVKELEKENNDLFQVLYITANAKSKINEPVLTFEQYKESLRAAVKHAHSALSGANGGKENNNAN